MAHPTHKAGSGWRTRRQAAAGGERTPVSHRAPRARLWARSGGRHAARAVAVRPALIADIAGIVAALALAATGAVCAPAQTRSAQSSLNLSSPVASASRSSSRGARSSSASKWSLASAGEFDISRAFSATDATKIREAVKEYKPAAAVDSNGRYQSIGVSAHQSTVTTDFGTYPFSECTWWAAVRRAQLGRPVPDNMGNGGQWADSGRAKGMSVDNTPHVGDVIVFAPGQAGAVAYYGHVAVVEAILSDGSIIISECSANYNGEIRTRRIWDASKYQYVH